MKALKAVYSVSPGYAEVVLPAVTFLTVIHGSFAEILLMAEPKNVLKCTNEQRKLQSEQKRMLIKTQSRKDTERIPKRPFPESLNWVWIFLFYF